MTESEQIQEWVNHYNSSHLKFNALKAVLENGGEAMLTKVLKKLGYFSAVDVIKNCPDEPFRYFQK